MRRYAETSSYFWTSIIRKVKSHHIKLIEEVTVFQKDDLRKYKEIRKLFESAQARYDSMLSKYMSVSKSKDPSSIREDAFQLAEARTAYFRSSFQLADTLSMTQSKLDTFLVKSLAEPWILSPSEFNHTDPVFQKVSIEMTRLKSWAKTMQKDYKPFIKQLFSSGKEIEHQAIQRFQPSRDLNEYTPQQSSLTRFVPDNTEGRSSHDEKHGWVFVKSVSKTRVTWVRRWIFVKNCMFGWLNISPSKTFVQESDKVGVLLCHVTPIPSEDRRFCFEIKTKDLTFVVQAETRAELLSWLQVFEDSKRLAVNSEKTSNIDFAFQRISPPLSEFASTANSSVDIELHDKALESPTSPQQVEFSNRSLFSDDITNSLREIMTAGESLTGHEKQQNKVNFITIGPFGSSLVSSPLINSPMPTSKSLEAILANSLINTMTLPTAVTANYWGSINWIVYKEGKSQESIPHLESTHDQDISLSDSVPGASNSMKETKKSNAHLFINRYPDYYPLDLRSQDAQLRALFQFLIEDNEKDRVVLAFRCLAKPNSQYEVTCRVFVTPTHMCLYSHSAGFTVTAISSLKNIISIESRQALNCDTLYFISPRGTTTCRVFLDSGRLLQKRLLLLVDNAHASKPLGLEELIVKLKSIGHEQLEDRLDQFLIVEGQSQAHINDIQYAEEVGQRYETQLRQFHDNDDLGYKKQNDTPITGFKPKGLSELRTPSDLSFKKFSKSSYSHLNDAEYAKVIYSELEQSMSQLSVEHIFDIPAKALFHIMFGEKSDVFLYKSSGMINRDSFEVTPWKLVGSARMEREIHHHIISTNSFSGEIQDRVMNVQRVERMNDCCFIVYERRAIWTLPQASFYTTMRYVILRTAKNSCQLSIWSSVEWLRSSIIKNMTEPYVLGKLKGEASIIMHRTMKSRQQLGSKGGTMTAIRLFGKLGTSLDEKYFESKQIGKDNIKDLGMSGRSQSYYENNQVILSQKSVLKSLLEIMGSLLVSLLGDALLVSRRVLLTIWDGIRSNKLLILGLLCSIFFNLIFAGKSTKDYWEARFAEKAVDSFQLLPTSSTLLKRSISLSDIDELITNGTSFSTLQHHESNWNDYKGSKSLNSSSKFLFDLSQIWTTNDQNDPMRTTLCYNRFRTLALEIPDFDSSFVEGNPGGFGGFSKDFGHSSEVVSTIRNRIHGFRSKLGIARNQLIIELRTINKIEKELIMAEWQTWLFDEVSMCSKLYDVLAISSVSRETGVINETEKEAQTNTGQECILNNNSKGVINVRRVLTSYCASCAAENRALEQFDVMG